MKKLFDYSIYGKGLIPFFCEGDDGGDGDGDGTGDKKGGGDAKSPVNTDGSFVENWHEKYGKENKATLSRFKTMDEFVTSHVSLRGKLGKNPDAMIEMPTNKSSKETWAEFHKRRNVPDTAEGYEFKKSDKISAKVELNDAGILNYKNIAKKWNFSPRQFNGAVNDYLVSMGADLDTFDTNMAEKKEARKTEGIKVWNQAFKGEAAARKAAANAVLDKYGLDTIKMPDGTESSIKGELFTSHPELLESPYFLMLLDKVRGAMSEDTLKGFGPTTGPTSEQNKTKLAEIRSEMSKIEKDMPINFRNDPKWKNLQESKHSIYKSKSA